MPPDDEQWHLRVEELTVGGRPVIQMDIRAVDGFELLDRLLRLHLGARRRGGGLRVDALPPTTELLVDLLGLGALFAAERTRPDEPARVRTRAGEAARAPRTTTGTGSCGGPRCAHRRPR